MLLSFSCIIISIHDYFYSHTQGEREGGKEEREGGREEGERLECCFQPLITTSLYGHLILYRFLPKKSVQSCVESLFHPKADDGQIVYEVLRGL